MSYIVFENDGVIDPRSITTFGVSSKENKNPIGFFGTGLKYAIAILLRSGHHVSIQSGGQLYKFDTVQDIVRVDTFEFIRMNGTALGFTTELGKNWKMWQAVREILCNCMDENGSHGAEDEYPDYRETNNKTRVIVSGKDFTDEYRNRHEIILDKPVIYENAWVAVSSGVSKHLYYRGIRIHELDSPSLFTYNITSPLTLTEDRTLKGIWDARYAISGALSQCVNKHIIEKVICAEETWFESDLSFHSNHSEEFYQCVMAAKVRLDRNLNQSALDVTKLRRLEAVEQSESIELNKVDRLRLDKAIDFSKKIGFDVDSYPIIVLETLGDGCLGLAHGEKIFLSTLVFHQGTKQVATTLIEEYIHLRHGFTDLTYNMQSFLFDVICSLGEQATGELL